MASAMIERAEFPVQRKRTLKGRPVTPASRATCRGCCRSGLGRRSLRSAAGLGMRHPGVVLAGAIAVFRAFTDRMESLPGNAGRVVDPGFLRFGVAASG